MTPIWLRLGLGCEDVFGRFSDGIPVVGLGFAVLGNFARGWPLKIYFLEEELGWIGQGWPGRGHHGAYERPCLVSIS